MILLFQSNKLVLVREFVSGGGTWVCITRHSGINFTKIGCEVFVYSDFLTLIWASG